MNDWHDSPMNAALSLPHVSSEIVAISEEVDRIGRQVGRVGLVAEDGLHALDLGLGEVAVFLTLDLETDPGPVCGHEVVRGASQVQFLANLVVFGPGIACVRVRVLIRVHMAQIFVNEVPC